MNFLDAVNTLQQSGPKQIISVLVELETKSESAALDATKAIAEYNEARAAGSSDAVELYRKAETARSQFIKARTEYYSAKRVTYDLALTIESAWASLRVKTCGFNVGGGIVPELPKLDTTVAGGGDKT